MNPVIKTENQPTLFKQEKTKTLIDCNLSDSKRQQTITVDNKRLINSLFLTNGISLRHKSSNILETTQKQAEKQKKQNENMDKRIEKRKALAALNKVIKTESDIDDAFFCSLGPVCLKYGTPGIPPKFKKAYGISHIIAKRDYEHATDPKAFPETGLQVARKLMDVIVYGEISSIEVDKQCVHLQKDGFEAVISQNWHGNKVNWLLTGWRIV